MAHNNWLGKGNDSYHLISPTTPNSDISTGNLSSVAPPTAPRSRYWARTLILLLVPLIITGYYYWIWLYLLSRPHDDVIKFGSATEIWVYYSWFIIGVFALEWSKHGLVGVEVAMLETKTFGAPHLVALLSHSEGTWSGPGGWFKCITKAFKHNQSGIRTSLGVSLKTYKLWYILAFISLSLYVGMPLSGLTMELSDGYVRLNEAPMVVGRNSTTFHKRYKLSNQKTNAAQAAWEMGSPATLPGIGIIYTPDYFDREGHDSLGESPNLLPTDRGIPEMFIVPQALGPISGRSWGLRVAYDCSIVQDVSDFTILGHHKGGPCQAFQSNSSGACATVGMFDEVTNLWSYSEVGTRLNVMELQNSHDTVGGKQEPLTSTINQANVLEWAVWQVRTEASYVEVKSFNNTIGTIVQGIGSPFMQVSDRSWVINTTFFEEKEYATFGNTSQDVQRKIEGRGKDTIEVAAAIGVRCVVRSVLGSAMIHEETSSFSDFKIEEPTPYGKVNAEGPMSRLGTNVEAVVTTASLEAIFKSINVRAMTTESNSVQVSKFVSSRELQKSAYLAWGHEVLNQMYDNYYGFETSWPYANLTSSKKGKVLTKGELPPGVEMTSPTNQESSRLFELPWEIRERIYEYYLSFDHDDFGDTLRPLHLYIEQGGYSKPIPPLMLTSKRAYRELHQRVHSDAVMRVHTAGWGDRRIGFAVHGKLRFERLRRLYVLVAMEYPNWNRWLGMLGEVTRRATNLNELVVDWEPRPSNGNTKVWEAKLTERKHDEFFRIISDLKNLQVVRFHGDMPVGWRDRFARETSARLVLYKSKWWKEPGME
ncbi:hypothetical protein CGCF245_v001541 [Colletotrichum fructicola]|nr:hypothetical protein CGCF245_v001541 [Colletotrichum fructicola]